MGKVTKTEIFLLVLTAAFILLLLASMLIRPFDSGSYTITQEHAENAERQAEQQDVYVHLNTATEEELQRLNGIGPVLAQSIVAYRQEHGPFTCPEELLAVDGIGEKTLDEIRDVLIIEEEP
ncbi:MAG: helix-hairpin-helix domain-containing protein [Clostridiales bacterium]|nr:helix-hairpin-helix domain-containing protein [Candidatus Cacconaster stercorequi]